MKWFIILAFWFLYWGLCFLCTGTDKKNLAGLRSYPDAVSPLCVKGLPSLRKRTVKMRGMNSIRSSRLLSL